MPALCLTSNSEMNKTSSEDRCDWKSDRMSYLSWKLSIMCQNCVLSVIIGGKQLHLNSSCFKLFTAIGMDPVKRTLHL